MKSIRLAIILTILFFIPVMIANAQSNGANSSEEIIYYPKLQSGQELSNVTKDIEQRIIKGWANFASGTGGIPESVVTSDDQMNIKVNSRSNIIYFSDILDYTITIHKCKREYPYYILFKDLVCFNFRKSELKEAQILADELFFIQAQFKKQYDKQDSLFAPLAAQYSTLKVKPPISEEQRKYIVQANVLNQQKEFKRAIGFYKKAIDLDQVAYPAAYSNLALLSAQVHRFSDAIYYMKKYLLLVPDASDARGAQDKIYEWELMVSK